MPAETKVDDKGGTVEEKPEVKTEKVETKTETKVEAKPEIKIEKVETKGGTKAHRIAADDEIPDDAELLELSKGALNARLNRATKKELKDRFGTDDPKEIKAKLDRLSELEAAEETRKREAMTEKERIEEDLRLAHQERDEAQRQLRMERETREVEHEDRRIVKIASKYIDDDEDTIEVVNRRFAGWLRSEYGDKLTDPKFDIPDKAIDAWFKDYAENHPKHARVAETKDPKTVRKVPLNNGAKGNDPAPDKTDTGAKNFSPSGPNAMDRQTAKQEAAKSGYHW
jgi:hypothetical protein